MKKQKNELLDLLQEKHTDWIKMVRSFSFNKSGKTNISMSLANDLVHDMYIKLFDSIKDPEKIMYNDTEINTMYIYMTLKSIYNNHVISISKKNKALSLYIGLKNYAGLETYSNYSNHTSGNFKFKEEIDNSYDENTIMNEKTDLGSRILDEVNKWHHYDAKLFKIIVIDGVSMRQLSRDTSISLTSIFSSIKSSKEKIRVMFNDEYKNINNN